MAPARRSGRAALIVASGVVVVVAALLAFSFGRLSVGAPVTPGTTSVEAGFARDMQTHHRQAVEMSMIVRDLTDDEDVRLLAYDIATTQGNQAGQMYGWLETWGLPQAPAEPSMTWMAAPAGGDAGHGHDGAAHTPGEPMPGLATAEQLAELSASSGVEAERLFLELMIAHHRGGVEMAEAVLDRTDQPVVESFANGVVASQEAEIGLMESMLAERS